MHAINDGANRPVLLVGASGRLGSEILRIFEARGESCRAATRTPGRIRSNSPDIEVVQCDLREPGAAERVVHGVGGVISCVGASVNLRAWRQRAPYESIDFDANRQLLNAALAARVRRFVYVSVYSTAELSATGYVRAHERFAETLRQSGLDSVIVRPTGFFYSYLEMLRMAQSGRGIVIGSGTARTNPIHEADVAELCVTALDGSDSVIDAGGPSVITREEIQAMAFRALDRPPRITRVPAGPFKFVARAMRPLHPRLGELLEFGTVASTVEIIAPARGQRHLEAYFRQAANLEG